jgi:hypothetical protein
MIIPNTALQLQTCNSWPQPKGNVLHTWNAPCQPTAGVPGCPSLNMKTAGLTDTTGATDSHLRRIKLLTSADSSVERSCPSCVASGAALGSRPGHSTRHCNSLSWSMRGPQRAAVTVTVGWFRLGLEHPFERQTQLMGSLHYGTYTITTLAACTDTPH